LLLGPLRRRQPEESDEPPARHLVAIDLTFHVAARHVTGSCFLLQSARCRFLVDCGMFQRLATVERNAGPLAFDPRELDFVLLPHAHVDHGGLLPRLATDGFTEPIYATAATADLLAIMLPDSAYLQQLATERAARTPKLLKQGPALPLPPNVARECRRYLECGVLAHPLAETQWG